MYLGLDLGTSGLKGILIDKNQDLIASAEYTYKVQKLSKGWSEQNPKDWIDACEKVIDYLLDNASGEISALRAIGISGQMHGATLLDKNSEVIRPCMLWNDTRAYKEAKNMDEIARFREISGNIVFPGFTAPKVAWIERNEPRNFKKISCVLLPKDYLRFWLTGDLISDMSDAAGTSWLDLKNRCWSEELLNFSKLDPDKMPTLVEGSQPVGSLRAELKRKWNISGDVIIAGGAGDNAAAACGCGVISEGTGFVSLGTSGVLLAARNGCFPAPETAIHTFCHAVPEKWYQMGVILAATDCLNWLSRITEKSPEDLSNKLSKELSGPSDVIFAPYLSGERTPHNDSLTRGAFIGLDVRHDIHNVTQAVLEGVCFALKDSLLALNKTGARVEKLFATGGGVNSKFWLKSLATILNIPLSIPKKGELGAALGAARLAIIARENMSMKNVMKEPIVEETIEPCSDLLDSYEETYRVYKNIYPSIKVLK